MASGLTAKQTSILFSVIGLVFLILGLYFLSGEITYNSYFYVSLALIIIGVALLLFEYVFGGLKKTHKE